MGRGEAVSKHLLAIRHLEIVRLNEQGDGFQSGNDGRIEQRLFSTFNIHDDKHVGHSAPKNFGQRGLVAKSACAHTRANGVMRRKDFNRLAVVVSLFECING